MHTEESIPELEELPRSKHLNLGTGRCRTGKVARLPKAVRDRINQMLRNAVPYQTILDSLGEFGQGINEDNLGNWKKGGYQDWLKEQESIEIIRVKQEFATDLFTDADPHKIHMATLQVAATNIVQLLLDLDPYTLRETLEKDAEKYTRLLNAIARLSEGEIKCERHRTVEAERVAQIAKLKAFAENKGGISEEKLQLAEEKLNLM